MTMTSSKPITSLLTRQAVVPANDDQIRQFGRFAEDGFRKRQKLWPNPLTQALIMGGEALQDVLSLAAEQFANTAKLREMIAAGSFGCVNPDITGERFAVLEAYDPRPFKPELAWPNKTVSTDTARKAVGEHKGTTAQFLKYLIDNQDAGMDFPIAHLGSECVRSDGNQCCLSASRDGRRRRLDLEVLRYSWNGSWRFFSTRELPLAA